MIVEIFECPKCEMEVAIADLVYSTPQLLNNRLEVPNHKILLLCLECDDVPVMQHLRTEIRDSDGNVGTVIV